MNKVNHDGIIALEQPFVKVPFEQLKKTFRTSQKYYEKELAHLGSSLGDLVAKTNADKVTPEEASKSIEAMVTRLQNLKRKLADVKAEETLFTTRSKIRLDHLNELTTITTVDSPEFKRWNRVRLDRVLVDYLLRRGFTETAGKVATEAGIEQMVDVELFAQASRVEEALQRHSCSECLQWCSDNKSNLRKMKSTLEFNLRLQEYIELVRARRMTEAIAYVRKHLTSWAETHLREIQQAMGLMAFPPETQCAPYKKLYDSNRWHTLILQFRTDNFALCSLPSQPLLSITLQAGLSALKTPQCLHPEQRNIHCPVCAADTLGVLAEKLPLSHHVNSTIVCRISGAIMNWDNPPMALENGQVYSFNALQDMAAKNNGKITCPRTGLVCEMSQLKKVFIS
ncbi:CTLH/CRA C-terminal to lish motif domain-containing protein [Jimgerdemannia flammicorona]|uniref:CTLH/CRA C-terminal to lish motif domain-containing protein n=1 Tax=Jimgerdemannia flammicorona TaxID=994334 RepID=A0A433PFP4_9FUNG|nr:CTLH/CRA C-terminal to lish motif domain-containing protein [Jimgerdemannia flammicorona]